MVCRFTGRRGTVVTTRTDSDRHRVVEVDSGPAILGDVADVALPIGIYMAGRLTGGGRAIVTTRAATADSAVIEIDRQPARGGCMAAIALPAGSHMGPRFTFGDIAVMAARASTDHIRMIEGTGSPGHCGMAVLARPCRRNVVRPFASCVRTIVTAGAIRDDTSVIETHVTPSGIGEVTVVARGIGLYMTGRLAGGCCAIVTTRTGTRDHRVIKVDLIPIGSRGMASLARSGGCYVCRILTSSPNPIMARSTTAGYAFMVEIGDLPATGGVAVVTGCISQGMGRTLAGRDVSVMTQLTWVDHVRVAETRQCPAIGGMADITGGTGGDMVDRLAAGCIAVVARLARIGHS